MSNDVENCPAEEFIKLCFADDCIGFWENLRDWGGNDFGGIYYSEKGLPDPDWYGYQLYNSHEALWNVQRLKFPNIPELRNNSDYKYNNKKSVGGQYSRVLSNVNSSIRLGSDSVMNIYWHTIKKQNLMEKLRNNTKQKQYIDILEEIKGLDVYTKKLRKYDEKSYKSNWKKFIWLYTQKANTIGGFVLFPRHPQSINQSRGTGITDDRFDLTLECFRRYFKNKNKSEDDINYNPLFSEIKRDSFFFDNMFGSFEKYTEFFCLNKSYDKKQNWVKDGQVLNLLNNQPLDDYDFGNRNNVLLTADNWWIFYRNIMNRLDARNEQIKEVIEGK